MRAVTFIILSTAAFIGNIYLFKYFSSQLPHLFSWIDDHNLFVRFILYVILFSLITGFSRSLLEITGAVGKVIYGRLNDVISMLTLVACIATTVFCGYYLWGADVQFNIFSIVCLILLTVFSGTINGLFVLSDSKIPLNQ